MKVFKSFLIKAPAVVRYYHAVITKALLEFKKPIINEMLVITGNKYKKLWFSKRKSLLENV